MTSFDDAVLAVKNHSAAFQSVLRSWPAYLGDGEGNVIGSQVNYYHCRYPTPESAAIEVYANGCPPNDGMRVMIGNTADQPDLIQVVSWNDSALDDTVNDHVKNHGEQHSYLGGDTVWVDWRQIMTFRVQPYAGLTVYVNGGVLPRAGADLQIIPQIVDLTDSVPGSSGQSRYALLSIDTTGAIIITDGSIVTPIMALDASDVPNTPSGNFRIAAVALQYGQTLITESLLQRDILDLRWPPESVTGTGVITPSQLANASAQYKYLVSGATPFAYAESAGALNIASGKTLTVSNSITLTGTDGGITALAVTSGKTLTFTAADDYNLTIPATGTAALLATQNVFTVRQWVQENTATRDAFVVKTLDDSSTNALIECQNSAGAALVTITPGGIVGIGGLAMSSGTAKLTVEGTINTAGYIFAMNFTPSLTSSNQHIYGGYFLPTVSVPSGKWSVSMAAGNAGLTCAGSNTHANFYASEIVTLTGTLATHYAYYSDALTKATNNYLLYGAGLGRVRIGDDVNVVGGADRSQLIVTGHTTQAVATPLVQFTRNDAAAGVSAMLGLTALGSGADGDGGSVLMAGKSSTTAAQSMAAIKYSWVSATHASRKAKVDLTVYDTAERTGLTVEADGAAADVYFTGAGGGLPYGSCWGNEINWSQASAAQNTWYVISDTDMTDGQLNLVTHDGSGKLTVTKAGRYYVVYTVSQTNDGNNKHIQTGIAINGTVQNDGINHVDGLAANIDTVLSGNAILALTASQYIEIAIRTTDTGTPTISVDHINITIFQVGG